MLGGFVLLSMDLSHRGHLQRSCPTNSFFDVLIFMSWSIVLLYLVVGSTYRLSLLGAFTSPLVMFILLFAQLAPIDRDIPKYVIRDPWIALHVALSLIAYGAFALAGIAGLMYLLQDRQLKRRKGGALLYNLPPITDLAIVNSRLLRLGFGLLTVGFAAGFISGMPINTMKFWASVVIWGIYGAMLVLRRAHSMPPRLTAELSMAAFLFALCALPVIQYLSIAK